MNDTLFDEKAEREVVGSLLIEPQLINSHDLTPDEFFIRRYGYLYKLLSWMASQNITIDILTVQQEMEKRNKLDYFGGLSELMALTNVVTTSHYATQCETIRDYSNRRRAKETAEKLVRAVHDTGKEFLPGEFINELMKTELGKSKTVHVSDGLLSFDEWVLDRIEKKQNGTLDAYPKTGIEEFDRTMIFLEGGQTTKIGGEPGVGKTMLVTQILQQATCPRIMFSMEMKLTRLVARMLSAETQIMVSAMRTGLYGNPDALLAKLREAYRKFENEQLFLNCSSVMTVEGMYSEIAKLKATGHDIKLIAIDYFGLIADTDKHETQTIKETVISQKLQRLVKELDVHALVIDSYNKAGFGKDRGSMAAIGGSAGKAYDADNIITLTAGEVTESGVQVFADFVKSRDGESTEKRIGLMREIKKPIIRSMTIEERRQMKAVSEF